MLLQAGPVQVLYENGFLRYFRLNHQEILRMVYFTVRDQDWNTVPGVVQDEKISGNSDSFTIRYTYSVVQAPVHFQWKVAIDGSSDGTIQFKISGVALSSFLKNRIGFCILHPVSKLAGQLCSIGHPDGTVSLRNFPEFVSPYQPFVNIRSMEWMAGENTRARLAFEGDVFETEDQRNWTDASYKTYCTPLHLPFPVKQSAGTEINQSVTFALSGQLPVNEVTSGDIIFITATGEPKPFPQIGLGMQAEGLFPDNNESSLLLRAGFSHLRADIFLSRSNWQKILANAFEQCYLLQMQLAPAIFCGADLERELPSLLDMLTANSNAIYSVLLFEEKSRRTTGHLLIPVIVKLREALPEAKTGGGTDAYFAEFNRNTILHGISDFVSFSINPQVHASDNLSLIENMSAQADAVKTAQHLVPGKPVHVSPVTLKPRFNPDATSGTTSTIPLTDNRQSTAFAAAWTLGSLKYLSEAGVASVTYYEATGPRGILAGSDVFPVGRLLTFIVGWKPQHVQPTHCNEPLKVSSLLLQKEQEDCLLITNHTGEEIKTMLPENFTPIELRYVITDLLQSQKPSDPEQDIILPANEIVAITGTLKKDMQAILRPVET